MQTTRVSKPTHLRVPPSLTHRFGLAAFPSSRPCPMSSRSPSPERTLNRVVRAGVTVANAARRRRTRRRARRASAPPPPAPPNPPPPVYPSTLHPPSLSFPDQLLTSNQSALPQPPTQTRRRIDLRETLLSFPEHDRSTVTALLNHYHGDRDRVIQKLSQARTNSASDPSSVSHPATSAPLPQTVSTPQEHRPTQPILPASPTYPPHHRRPSRRFSREAAAPLWAAAVRTTANLDIPSPSSPTHTLPHTPRIAGSKRPRSSPVPSQATHPSLASSPDLPPTPPTPPPFPTIPFRHSHSIETSPSQPQNVHLLLRRIDQLESALSQFMNNSETAKVDIARRLQSAQLEMGALERRHDTLEHELENSRKRVSKTEQYLDTMRRDVRYAIGGRESKFFVIIRQGMNGLLYYLLAYLVPVLFFVIRAVRSAIATVRRRVRGSQ